MLIKKMEKIKVAKWGTPKKCFKKIVVTLKNKKTMVKVAIILDLRA
jgi:hypothetical protein